MATLSKVLPDRWSGNPPQVTSFLTLPATPVISHTTIHTFSSPTCGFGWGFRFSRNFVKGTSPIDNSMELLTGQIGVTFEPRLCKGMGISPVSISVNARFPSTARKCSQHNYYGNVPINADRQLGTYEEPSSYYDGKVEFEITLVFDPKDNLSLPTTAPVNVNGILADSLRGIPVNDTKFYLNSARVRGKPGRPRVIYGSSNLLQGTNEYLQRILDDGGERDGVVRDLYEDVDQAINELKQSSYDYDSDSDLETVLDEEEQERVGEKEKEAAAAASIDNDDYVLATPTAEGNGKAKKIERALITVPKLRPSDDFADPYETPDTSFLTPHDVADKGKVFVVCGTAYQTWKAFLYYAYTNEIYFKPLRSERRASPTTEKPLAGTACSPKSMFRLASTKPDLSSLKNIAKEAIRTSLSEENIVEELFSSFTSRYKDILNMELDFLLQNLSLNVSEDLNRALQLVIIGRKPHCQPLLATVFRRLRGDDVKMGTNEPHRDHLLDNHPSESSQTWLPVEEPEPEARKMEEALFGFAPFRACSSAEEYVPSPALTTELNASSTPGNESALNFPVSVGVEPSTRTIPSVSLAIKKKKTNRTKSRTRTISGTPLIQGYQRCFSAHVRCDPIVK